MTQSTACFDKTTIFHIRDFGASGDGTTDDTAAIQQAIDVCSRHGNGIVLISAGTYFITPLYLRSHVRLHLEKGATLLGSPRPDDYHDWRSEKIVTQGAPYNCKALLIAEDEENIAITGEGTIDGQGDAFYDQSAPQADWWPILDKKARPGRMVMFLLCRNVRIEGVRFVQSPAWTFWVFGCERVHFHAVTIRTNPRAINTDGIDIDACHDVTVSHCTIHTGDDAIILRAIDRVFKPGDSQPCERITVENCELVSRCNAIRFSYIGDGIIRNVVMRNLSISGSRRGIICQIPTRQQTPERNQPLRMEESCYLSPVVENLYLSNITIEANQPLWFFLADEGRATRLSNITLENIRATGGCESVFKGNETTFFENVTLRNVRFILSDLHPMKSFEAKEEAAALYVDRCRQFTLQQVSFEGETGRLGPGTPLVSWQEVEAVEAGGIVNRTRFAFNEASAAVI